MKSSAHTQAEGLAPAQENEAKRGARGKRKDRGGRPEPGFTAVHDASGGGYIPISAIEKFHTRFLDV